MKFVHSVFLLIVILLYGCGNAENQNPTEMNENHKNKLSGSSSPYLLQHANNPVFWYPWGKEALQLAKEEDKPILVSIGYSSCHWCHVMERESFENDSIAEIMNRDFICIKVDREERPDIDQIYMEAVQAMGLQGGWPLNVFLTPDQRPFYGGTYFPPRNWAQLLTNIAKAFDERRSEIEESAGQITDAIGTSELLRFKLKPTEPDYTTAQQEQMFEQLKTRFDTLRGGQNKAPKFPMPSIWKWLLKYAVLGNDREALDQVHRTLTAMAFGGIYDHVGGGFARYSTDAEWHAPHFEKMLYDNAQLLSLYSEAYILEKNETYREVIEQTIGWLRNEMTSPEGGFYSALDADSEGVEGKFYVWDFREFNDVLGPDAELLAAFYQVGAEGNWEGTNILHQTMSDSAFATKKGLDLTVWKKKRTDALRKLKLVRSTRIRPGLDNKILTGWNAMMITGLLDAYDALQDPSILELALTNAEFVLQHSMQGSKLFRTPPTADTQIEAYLEDYAFMISASIDLYEHTFDEKWIGLADRLMTYVMKNFLDEKEDMFFYTDGSSHELVVRKKEMFDNVIPASNSEMATCLFRLGTILDKEDYLMLSDRMLSRMNPMIPQAVPDMANWAQLHLLRTYPTGEIVFTGNNALEYRMEFIQRYIPNKIILGTTGSSSLPLIEGKTAMNDRTTIYVCYNKTCKLPVNTVEEAYELLK